MYEKIPQPPTRPLVGNAADIDPSARMENWLRLSKIYGPIFHLSLPQRNLIILSSQELVNEACDEKRFNKRVGGALNEVRSFTGDGLFTAQNSEKNYGKGHRILASAFSPVAMHGMFEGMMDIAEQLVLRWKRFGEDSIINVSENYTRVTLDTIGLCAFNYRFNSFYQNELHPFVNSMVRALHEAGSRARRTSIQNKLMIASQRQFNADIQNMQETAGKIIEERRRKGQGEKKDVLDIMLTAKDPVTGEGLSDENIRYQMVTFLIAGHETTSGLLSFATYELLKNPSTLQKAREEVDKVLGTDRITIDHIPKLVYLNQILKETLRLYPSAPAFTVASEEDTVLGGKYQIKKSDDVVVFIAGLHRDPTVWGPNVEEFDPDRFSPEKMGTLPPNSWKPFGNGMRACIGRFFAIQEVTLVLALILQQFDLIEENPSYQLKIREALTIKPENFFIRVKTRGTAPHVTPISLQPPQKGITEKAYSTPANVEANTPLLVLYGSNSGSSESFASRIASESKLNGYYSTLATLDEYVGHLPTSGGVVIVTSSYEGHPTDNAKQFVSWLDTLQPDSLKGVKYTVFGCGDRDWLRTYQAIPKRIDEKLAESGATRIKDRGEADAKGDFFGDFDQWNSTLWSTLSEKLGTKTVATTAEPMFEVEIVKETRSVFLRQTDLQPGEIIENKQLAGGPRPKRHIEVALPEGITYRAGDYLVVLPMNSGYMIDRALKQFGLNRESQIIIHSDKQTYLPTGYSVNITVILAAYVELSQPATRKQILKMAEYSADDKDKLISLAEKSYKEEILEKHTSILDLLNLYPSCKIPLGLFLEMLPPMRTREYSISSSPLWKEDCCTITLSVVDAPAWSGVALYKGVASNYLATATEGRKVTVTVHPSATFHLPGSPTVPIILVGAGTGIAPLRGFIQERAIQIQNGRTVGDTLLFFGCPGPDDGFLYKEELDAWEKIGAVKVRTAFFRVQGAEAKYVQDRLWIDRKEVMDLMNKDARIYVCGEATKMAPAVRSTFIKIYQEQSKCTDEEGEEWMNNLERLSVRYVSDVFT
uniref:Predicted protein n=1 Tax=Hordeum vulgare subsp. vulgare TaxID=112509 RepID=F2DP99_HORVV|nr:predicted protein [Hordeum vulgare subsp. vulgare]